jgi:hypothetical protein
MRRGDFAAAWRISDANLAARPERASCWHLPRHEQWVWTGRPLAGQRVLVRCYHGLGDTLQFARFLPQLAPMCRELTLWVQPALIPLLGHMSATFKLLPLHDGTPEADFDVDIEIMELAHALRVTVDSLPGRVPYFSIRAEARRSAAWSIGLVTRAGEWDEHRSLPVELAETLTELPGICTFNLQPRSPVPRAHDISTPDIATLAARMQSLDLVISVDTMAAHLAGALAVPTWTLLRADADWRWMADREDSPWYPTMRLFRQPVPGDWESVVCRVRQELTN